MSDMTLCSSEGCPKEGTCLRKQTAPSPFWQSYAEFEFDEDGCDEYLEVSSNDARDEM